MDNTLSTFLGDFCPNCKQFRLTTSHQCPPTWLVTEDESADAEWDRVYGDDAEDAACTFVAEGDGSATFMSERRIVWVRKDEDSKAEAYEVTGELVPRYCAYRTNRGGPHHGTDKPDEETQAAQADD